jgi:phage terminase large subunit-like protein
VDLAITAVCVTLPVQSFVFAVCSFEQARDRCVAQVAADAERYARRPPFGIPLAAHGNTVTKSELSLEAFKSAPKRKEPDTDIDRRSKPAIGNEPLPPGAGGWY